MSFEGPEIEAHRPHHHGGMPRWLEMLLSVSALIVSVSSIAIALHHGEIMEKLVQANSYPYLEIGPSNATPTGEMRLSLDITNNGVGPADEQSLRLKVAGRYVHSYDDLLVAVLGPQDAARARPVMPVFRNVAPTRFIRGAGGEQFIFRVARTTENAPYWSRIDHALSESSQEVCYCSVFHECWELKSFTRTPVKQCVRNERTEFTP